MKDRAALFRSFDRLPKALRDELNFCACPPDVEQIRGLYDEARRDIGYAKAVDWLRRSVRAHDEDQLELAHRAAGVSVLRFRPAVRRRARRAHKLAPEVREYDKVADSEPKLYRVRQYRPAYFSGFATEIVTGLPRDQLTTAPFCRNFEHHDFKKFTVTSYGNGELVIEAKYKSGASWVVGFAAEEGTEKALDWRYDPEGKANRGGDGCETPLRIVGNA